MQLVFRNGFVVAVHDDEQNIDDAYPQSLGFEITNWDDSIRSPIDEEGNPIPDPRTPEQKDQDNTQKPLRRVMARMPVKRLFYLLYQDRKNGTNKFVEFIDTVRAEVGA